jgi:ribosomal protein L7Ae-like RNA K-turn-binding protein
MASRRMSAPEAALRYLGLAARGGAVVPGTERVREAVRGKGTLLVLLATDASENSRDKLMPLLTARGTPHAVAFTRAQLGWAVGRSPLGAVAITDAGLAGRIAESLPRVEE